MLRYDDFKKEDGSTDYEAYRKAQINCGEACFRCGQYIVMGGGGKQLCYDCKEMDSEEGDVRHHSRVRCPHCKHVMDVCDSELYELYEDGDHDIYCGECGKEFTVVTTVTHSFESPELSAAEQEEVTV